MKNKTVNNPVAKHNFNKGGFHTPAKFVRKMKHVAKGRDHDLTL